jgi:hypothetical protein
VRIARIHAARGRLLPVARAPAVRPLALGEASADPIATAAPAVEVVRGTGAVGIVVRALGLHVAIGDVADRGGSLSVVCDGHGAGDSHHGGEEESESSG